MPRTRSTRRSATCGGTAAALPACADAVAAAKVAGANAKAAEAAEPAAPSGAQPTLQSGLPKPSSDPIRGPDPSDRIPLIRPGALITPGALIPDPKVGPDPSKEIYGGYVDRQSASGDGFIICAETFALYQQDVYMWRTYFTRCKIGDWIRFNVYVSDKGHPQVCWMDGGTASAEQRQIGVVPGEPTREKSRSACINWNRDGTGTCIYGDACFFRHDYSDVLCRFWTPNGTGTETCTLGDRCRCR